ncbi:hypothetical protein ZWY2020_040398 [Hordeum vulgare]|nr:hypothetical protein ZWY2020_040398 [Hordeum vulgare]
MVKDWESAIGSRTAVQTPAGDDDYFKSGGDGDPAVRLADLQCRSAPRSVRSCGSHLDPAAPPVAHAPQAPQRHSPAGSVRFCPGSRSATRRPSMRKHRHSLPWQKQTGRLVGGTISGARGKGSSVSVRYRFLSEPVFSSTTPYTTTKFLSYIEQLAQLPNIASVSATETPINRDADGAQQPTKGDTNEADGRVRNVHEPPLKNMEGGDDVCGSLEDWLHPLPTFEDSELPPHMRAIFNKHKDIHAAELKGAFSSFGSLLEGINCKRMGLMLSEASKAGFRSDEAKHECPDVTFDVPVAPAPGMSNATASDSSPQQQKQLDSTTGTANATVNISSPQQPKQHKIRVQVTTTTAQCTFTASTVQQASQLNDTNSVETKVVVGKTDFAHQPHKSKSEHNSGIDFSNAKGEDICSEANKFERMSPRSTSYPCVNLIRRPGTLEDGPCFGLFEPGSPDALLFQDVPQVE